MAPNYVLIDYENVQPEGVEALEPDIFHVLVFVGASQSKVGLDLANLIARKGAGSRFIQISGNGRNALDFHIACYVGRLVATEPDAHIHIISADKGMDPLIEHLRQQGSNVSRWGRSIDIPIAKKPTEVLTLDDQLSLILEYLIRRGSQRPASVKTLLGSVCALFQPKLEVKAAEALLGQLEAEWVFDRSETKVIYALPD